MVKLEELDYLRTKWTAERAVILAQRDCEDGEDAVKIPSLSIRGLGLILAGEMNE
jgi:hypothetical protein